MTSRWLNFVRAISREGFGRMNYYQELRGRLDTDGQFSPFFEQESDELPEFYVDLVRLGTLWGCLPAGGLNHDPFGYMKSEVSATKLVSVPLKAAVRI
jgi:hypothetical protein